jgi:hypothetical protein
MFTPFLLTSPCQPPPPLTRLHPDVPLCVSISSVLYQLRGSLLPSTGSSPPETRLNPVTAPLGLALEGTEAEEPWTPYLWVRRKKSVARLRQ